MKVSLEIYNNQREVPVCEVCNPFSADVNFDNELILMEYRNGSRVSLHINTHSTIPQRRMLICGTEGTIEGIILFLSTSPSSSFSSPSSSFSSSPFPFQPAPLPRKHRLHLLYLLAHHPISIISSPSPSYPLSLSIPIYPSIPLHPSLSLLSPHPFCTC